MNFLKNIIKWLALLGNLAVVLLVLYSFYDPDFVIYTVVAILLSFTLNEALVEHRLQKVEEVLIDLYEKD